MIGHRHFFYYFVIVAAALSGCSTGGKVSSAETLSAEPAVSGTADEATAPSMDAGISAAASEYTRLSPSSIKTNAVPGIAIDVVLYARESCLKIEVTASGFKWPAASPADSRFIRDLKFMDGMTGAALPVEEVMRGGGGGGEGADAQTEEMFEFDVKVKPMPLSISAIITFDGIFGISHRVRFTLAPIPRPNMQCPQLPATTPEG